MADFRPLFPTPDGAGRGFVPLHESRVTEAPTDDGSGFTAGFRPLVPGRMGAEFVALAPTAGPDESPIGPVHEDAEPPPSEEQPAVDADLVTEGSEDTAEVLDDAPEDIALHRARDEAFELGRQEGVAAGEAEMADRLQRLETLLATLESTRREMFERTVTDIAAAVRHIAQDVVHRELLIDTSGVEALVIDVLDHVQADDEIVVYVAPEDEQAMQVASPGLLSHLGRDAMVRIQADPELTPGGAKIQTALGSIDASVETRFAAFADAVDEWAAEEASDARS